MSFRGAADNSRSDRDVGGWVKTSEGKPVRVVALRDGVTVVNGTTSEPRGDIAGDDCGFRLMFPDVIPYADLLSGKMIIEARAEGYDPIRLPIIGNLRTKFELRDCLNNASLVELRSLLRDFRTAADGRLQSGKGDSELKANLTRLTAALDWAAVEPVGGRPTEVSNVALPIGSVSPDQSVILGRRGHMFLREGSNNLAKQFAVGVDAPQVVALADRWKTVFERRAELLAAADVRYLQIIIPEKVCVLPDCWPDEIVTPTPALRRIERLATENSEHDYYKSALNAFLTSRVREQIFRKVDTHLSPRGTAALMSQILVWLGFDAPFGPLQTIRQDLLSGDVGRRFLTPPFYETVDFLGSEELDRLGAGVTKTILHQPPPGKHMGAHVVWDNPNAPIDRSVMIFGNSFIEYCDAMTALSWWAARAFRRVEFLWGNIFDFRLVAASKPDIVIGQTIERFLWQVPDDVMAGS